MFLDLEYGSGVWLHIWNKAWSGTRSGCEFQILDCDPKTRSGTPIRIWIKNPIWICILNRNWIGIDVKLCSQI
jgi:hypothetical protein